MHATRMKRWRWLIVFSALALLLTACPEEEPDVVEEEPDVDEPDDEEPDEPDDELAMDIQERTLRVQSTSPRGDPWQDALEVFAEGVEEGTGGAITVDVFCCGELASNTVEEIEAIAQGDLDGAFIAGQALTVYDEAPAVMTLPFIAADSEAYHRMLDGPGHAVWEESLVPLGLHPITSASSNQGFRQLTNSVRPIRTPEDVEGLTFRVTDIEVYHDVIAELGADFVSMPFSDVPGALQQGVVDGQENPLNLIEAAGLYEFQDYLTIWNYSGNPIVFAMTEFTWAELEPEAQAVIEQAAVEAAMWHREAYVEADAQLIDELDDGERFEQVDVLDDAELEAFREALQPVYDRWQERLGAERVDEFEQAAQGQ